ncbi:type III secretion system chaperone [Desulfovibrio sp. OttesenSCG-928-F20]|nr:type III secretion system chaperone [Desulfovibrio sp. OttesenSCG-928-F20]
MNYTNDINRLLAVLAEQTDLPVPPLNATGQCEADLEGTPFLFSYDQERQCLFILSACGVLDRAEDPDAVLEAVLAANHLWEGTAGGVLGLDEASGCLLLSYRLDFPLPDEVFPEDLLCEILPHLRGVSEWCRDLVEPEL